MPRLGDGNVVRTGDGQPGGIATIATVTSVVTSVTAVDAVDEGGAGVIGDAEHEPELGEVAAEEGVPEADTTVLRREGPGRDLAVESELPKDLHRPHVDQPRLGKGRQLDPILDEQRPHPPALQQRPGGEPYGTAADDQHVHLVGDFTGSARNRHEVNHPYPAPRRNGKALASGHGSRPGQTCMDPNRR